MNDQRIQIKNKKKRQRKTGSTEKVQNTKKDDSATEIDERVNELHKNTVYSKQSIQFRNDNVVHIVSENKQGLDENTDSLLTTKGLAANPELSENEIDILNMGTRKLFVLCLNTSASVQLVKGNLIKLFEHLKNILVQKNISMFSISKDIDIRNIHWLEIENMLNDTFKETNIKIIICMNYIEYVNSPENRDSIFEMYHSSKLGGHSGVNRTYNRIRDKYCWENLKRDIQNRILKCEDCQRNKLKRKKTRQPMVITDTPFRTIDKVAMDIMGPFSVTKTNKRYILSIQDLLSKHITLAALEDQTAEAVSEAFIKKFMCTFGSPKVVLTDRAKNFTSNMLKQIAKRYKFKKIETTAFSPQSNGSVERANHPLCEYIKNFTSKNCEWDQLLEFAQFNYNTSVHTTHNFTPHELIYGFPARVPSSAPIKKSEQVPTYKGYLENLVKNIIEMSEIARNNSIISKQKSKERHDKNINPVDFKIGDRVWFIKEPKPGKLEKNQNLGPFEILRFTDKGSIIINYNGKPKTVHPNKLVIAKSQY